MPIRFSILVERQIQASQQSLKANIHFTIEIIPRPAQRKVQSHTMQRGVIFSTIFLAFMLHSSHAICKRPEELKDWKRKSLTERAVVADIVIYGKVVYSPCWKAGYVKPSTIPIQSPTRTAATNSTRNTTTASKEVNTTSSPALPKAGNTSFPTATSLYTNCSSSFYSAIIQVYCVIKGGILPAFILLHGFGHGEGICLKETYHDYHAYRNLNYVIFIGR